MWNFVTAETTVKLLVVVDELATIILSQKLHLCYVYCVVVLHIQVG